MNSRLRQYLFLLLAAAGLVSLFYHTALFDPLAMLATFLGLTFWLVRKRGRIIPPALLPLASGLLCWPMKLFWWDRWDFLQRVHNLLILIAVFMLLLALREHKLGRKILHRCARWPLKKRLLLIFSLSELFFLLGSFMLLRKGITLVGDEPHYLAIAQSLSRDRDLNVFNQYFRLGFREFLAVERLPAHATFGIGYKKMYSFHLPGLSFTLAPFFLLHLPQPWLYFLIRAYLGLFAAALITLIHQFILRLWQRPALALVTSAIFATTAPVFFFAIHIFPEIQALFLLLAALYLLLFSAPGRNWPFLLAGLFLGLTIFWGVKYALFIGLFAPGFAIYFLKKKRWRNLCAFLFFPLLLQLLFFAYLHMAYGNFSPSSIYRGLMSTAQKQQFYQSLLGGIPFTLRLETLGDYFLDQRDGLLLYNPFYFFAIPGLILALKRFRTYFRQLLLSLPALLFILYHAYSTIRAGVCPQARYLVPVIWALLLFCLVYYRETPNRLGRRLFKTAALYGIFVTAYQLLQPLTLYQSTTHDSHFRPGLLFQQWGGLHLPLPNLLPSFSKMANQQYWPNYCAIGLVIAATIVSLLRCKRLPVALQPVFFFLIFVFCSLFPRPGLYNPHLVHGSPASTHWLYAGFYQPGDSVREVITIDRRTTWRPIIRTQKPAKIIDIVLASPSAPFPLQVAIANFDRPCGQYSVRGPGAHTISIFQPQGKLTGRSYCYQFTLRIWPERKSENFRLLMQIYPRLGQ